MVGGVPGVNRCAPFFRYNSGKYSIALNLKHPDGLRLAEKLVAWADVVTENFIPGTLEKWGLSYEDLQKQKSDIIFVRGSMQGQQGYYAKHPGFGTHIMGLSGYADLVGWPDGLPVGTSAPVTDFVGGWYFLLAILGALDYRRRTGKGQYIDMAQLEAGLTLLSQNVLDYTLNGRLRRRSGNRSPEAAPHGIYRCKGDERWCCIAVFTDDEWRSLCVAMENQALAQDPRFRTLSARKQNEDELDRTIEHWTIKHSPEEVMGTLQTAGVAAGVVKNGRDVCEDPQLERRGHFQILEQQEVGTWPHETAGFRMENSTFELKAAPCLGEHTEFVCREILEITDEEFVRLLSDGVFE
jgi:crotonobetainyl-CoA:carnitine CoA-transferase CaiB-like acyl-CoA transferase